MTRSRRPRVATPASIVEVPVEELSLARATGGELPTGSLPFEGGETVIASRFGPDGVEHVVTTHGRKVAIAPDGSFAVLVGPSFPPHAPEDVANA